MKMNIKNFFSINLIGFVIPAIVGFTSIIYLQREVINEIFVTISFIWTMLTIFGISDLGFSRLSARETASYRLKKNSLDLTKKLISKIIFNSLSISLIVLSFLLLLIYVFISDTNSKVYLYYFALALPLFVINSVFRGISEGNNDFYTVNFIKIIFSSFVFLFPIVQQIIFSEIYLFIYLILIIFLRIFLLIFLFYRNYEFLRNFYKNLSKKSFFSFYIIESPALAFSGILGAFIIFIERGLFESFFPNFYYEFFLAHQIIISVWFIPSALSLTLFPTLANYNKNSSKEEIYKYMPYIFLLGLAAMVAIPLVIFVMSLMINLQNILNIFLFSFYLSMSIGVMLGIIAQTLNIHLLAMKAYKYIFIYATIIFIFYVPSLAVFSSLSLVGFLVIWNLRYLVDLSLIYFKFSRL